jgi:hypothetical protein
MQIFWSMEVNKTPPTSVWVEGVSPIQPPSPKKNTYAAAASNQKENLRHPHRSFDDLICEEAAVPCFSSFFVRAEQERHHLLSLSHHRPTNVTPFMLFFVSRYTSCDKAPCCYLNTPVTVQQTQNWLRVESN